MLDIAKDIAVILEDYCANPNKKIDEDSVIAWVKQFEECDQLFILEEFLHILRNGVYVSRIKAKEVIKKAINQYSQLYKYPTVLDYLADTNFLDMQPPLKSQSALLEIVDEILKSDYNMSLNECGTYDPKNFLYLDDILATGSTIKGDCLIFLEDNYDEETSNFNAIKSGKIRFDIFVLACQTLGKDNINYALAKHFDEESVDSIFRIRSNYYIYNNSLFGTKKFNLVYPQDNNIASAVAYLNSLKADGQVKRTYRPKGFPLEETFFSTPENRSRFESIILNKGIEILGHVQDLKANHRPLGATYPSYKTFGTGTMFFTWRNISNTSPIVFWWDNAAHHWHGLFPLQNRGQH